MNNITFCNYPDIRRQWPCGSLKDITILSVIDPVTFWVKEARSTSMSHDARLFYDMEAKMSEYCENYEDNSKYLPKKGEICCIKLDDNWARARVLMKAISPSRGTIVRLFLVDHCKVINVLENETRVCNKEWQNVPFQAVKLVLFGISSLRMKIEVFDELVVTNQACNTWDESALAFVKSAIKDHTKAKLNVIEHHEEHMKVDLILYTNESVNSLSQVLINNKYAVNNNPEQTPSDQITTPSNKQELFTSKLNKFNSSLHKELSLIPKTSTMPESHSSNVSPSPITTKNEQKLIRKTSAPESQSSNVILPPITAKNGQKAQNVHKTKTMSETLSLISKINAAKKLNASPNSSEKTKVDEAIVSPIGKGRSAILSKLLHDRQNSIHSSSKHEPSPVGHSSNHAVSAGRGALLSKLTKARTDFQTPMGEVNGVPTQSKFGNNVSVEERLNDLKTNYHSESLFGRSKQPDKTIISPDRSVPSETNTPPNVCSSPRLEQSFTQSKFGNNSSVSVEEHLNDLKANGHSESRVDLNKQPVKTIISPDRSVPSETKTPPNVCSPPRLEKSVTPKSNTQIQKSILAVLKCKKSPSQNYELRQSTIKSNTSSTNVTAEVQVKRELNFHTSPASNDRSEADSTNSAIKCNTNSTDVSAEVQVNRGLNFNNPPPSNDRLEANSTEYFPSETLSVKLQVESLDENGQDYNSPTSDDEKMSTFQNTASFNTQMDSTFETLHNHIVGQVYSAGERVPAPYTRVDNNFVNSIVERLYKLCFKAPSVIQRHAWPSINRGRNVIVVALPSAGNILIYLIPILSSLSEPLSYNAIPSGNGPLALIVCKSSESAQYIHDVTQSLICGSKIKCQALYPGVEDLMKVNLINGCDILITTPHSLLRLMESGKGKTTNLQRLCHLVLNDADILVETCPQEIMDIMSVFLKVILSPQRKSTQHQLITCSTTWNVELARFVDCYFHLSLESSFSAPVFHFSSYCEVAIYTQLVTIASVIPESCIHTKLTTILDENTQKKTIIFLSDDYAAVDLYNLAKSLSRNAFLVNKMVNNAEVQGVKSTWMNSHDAKSAPLLICTDSCVSDLNIRDAQCIIHYDIPELSRTSFGIRFTALHDNLKTTSEDADNDDQCVCYLILTNKCIKQSPAILKFLQRVKAKVPDSLADLVRKRNKDVEESKMSEDLCYYFKAFGECRFEKLNKRKCKYRHQLNKDMDEPFHLIPQSGYIRINITEVISAGHYYAHIVDHYDTDNYSSVSTKKSPSRTSFSEQCFSLFMDMSIYFSVVSNHFNVKFSDIKTDALYAINWKNTYFSRVKVIKILKNKDFSSSFLRNEVLVSFIDDGMKKKIAANNLLELPSQFQNIPHQAIEVYICNVMPCDHEIEWSMATNINVSNKIQQKNVVGKIKLCIGNSLWLDPLIQQEILDGANTTVNAIKVDKYLLENGWAQRNDKHLTKLRKACEECGIKVPNLEEFQKKNSGKCANEVTIEDSKCNYGHLDMDSFTHVQVSVVSSPHSFYVQKVNSYECLTDLTKELNVWSESTSRHFVQNLQVGLICIAYFEDQKMWCRSRITEVIGDGNHAIVFFLDYGDMNEVPKNEILQIPDKFLLLPFQAIECALADVALSENNDDWSDTTIDVFESYTRDPDGLLAYLPLKVFKKVGRKGIGNLYQVYLLKPGIYASSIGRYLIENQLASEPIDEVNVDDILQQYNNMFDSASDYNSDSASIKNELENLKIMKEYSAAKSSSNKPILDTQTSGLQTMIEDQVPIEEEFVPSVKWAQTKSKIKLSIKLNGVKEYNMIMQTDSLTFSTVLDCKFYKLNLKFFGKIDSTIRSEKELVKVLGTEVFIAVTKLEPLDVWPRLLETEEKPPYLGIDFDRNDIDSEDSEDEVSVLQHPRMQQQLREKLQDVNSKDNIDMYSSSDSIPSSLQSERDEFELFC